MKNEKFNLYCLTYTLKSGNDCDVQKLDYQMVDFDIDSSEIKKEPSFFKSYRDVHLSSTVIKI